MSMSNKQEHERCKLNAKLSFKMHDFCIYLQEPDKTHYYWTCGIMLLQKCHEIAYTLASEFRFGQQQQKQLYFRWNVSWAIVFDEQLSAYRFQ